MLETFLALKIRDIEKPGDRAEKIKEKKDLRQNMSRKERKVRHLVLTVFSEVLLAGTIHSDFIRSLLPLYIKPQKNIIL